MTTNGKRMNDFRVGLQSAYLPHDPVDQEPGEAPSMTRQEFAEECDINAIMARYEKVGGGMPPVSGLEPQYLDLTGVPTDFHGIMDAMMAADAAFMTLPARCRAEFDNDPVRFVEFAQDRANLERMREWGLAAPAEAPAPPVKVELVPASGAAPGQPAASPAAPGAPTP